jgi:hypothetical protein
MSINSEGFYNDLPRGPMLLAALAFTQSGIRVFPCNPRSKRPLTMHGFKDATIDQDIVVGWWTQWPHAMIGMPTGTSTETFVVDLDTKGNGIEHFAALCEQHGGIPTTKTSTTPSGGRHLFFHYPLNRHVRNSASKLGGGIDVRGQGGYIILPPSQRHDGAAYRWHTSSEDIDTAEAPEWLLNLIDAPTASATPRTNGTAASEWAQAALRNELGTVLNAGVGVRNDTLNHASYALGQIVAGGALAHAEVVGRLIDAALAVGLDRDEAERTITSGMKAGADNPRKGPAHASWSRPAAPDCKSSEPLPLYPPLPPEEPYPLEALGPLLSKAAQAIARKVQVPAAIAGQSVLAVASLAAQPLADVRMPYGQRRPLSLFCVSIAVSGDRKTGADIEALKPVRQYERELREKYEQDFREWQIEHTAWEAQKHKIEKARQGSLASRKAELQALGPEPEKPLLPVLTAPDPTIEGLARMWVDAPAALGIFSAEGGQFLGGPGMLREHKQKTGAALSLFWDGSGYRRVRAGDGFTDLLGRRLSFHLMVQPDSAKQFLADPVLRDQGLLSRCLAAAPTSLSGTRFYRDPDPDDLEAIAFYTGYVQEILALHWPLVDGKRNELEPPELVFSSEAFAALRTFSDNVESQCGPEGELSAVRDVAAKIAEQAVRIAGVLTIIEDPQACEISAETMINGITLAKWYLQEALRLHGAARTNPKLLRAQCLLDWMKRRSEPVIKFRDILRYGPGELRTKAPAAEAIQTLDEHGLIIEVRAKPLSYQVLKESPHEPPTL